MKQYDQTLANCQNTRGTVRSMTKRDFLSTAAMGIGGLGLASLMEPEDLMAAGGTGKAKRVIHIFLQGAPSHIDTFDPKPRNP